MLMENERWDLAVLSKNFSRELWEQGISRGESLSLIRSMLTECTGRSILDSGDHYGRGWERSAMNGFPEGPIPPQVSLEFGYLEVTIDLASYLAELLEYDPEGDSVFQEYSRNSNSRFHLEDIDGFLEFAFPADSLSGIYGEGGPVSFNTYNDQNLLSRDFQGTFFYTGDRVPRGFVDNEPYLLFHTHNGADIRGGYGVPRLFRFKSAFDAESLFYWGNCTIGPKDSLPQFEKHNDLSWQTDDAYRWCYGDSWGIGNREYWIPIWRDSLPLICSIDSGSDSGILWVEWNNRNLEEYDTCADSEEFPDMTGGFLPGDPGSGVLVETDLGVHCPITGSVLVAF